MAAPCSVPSPAPAGRARTRVLAPPWHGWAGAKLVLWVSLAHCCLGAPQGCLRPPGTSAKPEHLIADGC